MINRTYYKNHSNLILLFVSNKTQIALMIGFQFMQETILIRLWGKVVGQCEGRRILFPLVRKDMSVNEHARLSKFTFGHILN